MDAELSNQDLDSVTALDNDLREENINVSKRPVVDIEPGRSLIGTSIFLLLHV